MKVVVYGAGGHGKVVADILLSLSQHEVVGFIDGNESLYGSTVLGLPVCGGESWLRKQSTTDHWGVALGIGNNYVRGQIVSRLRGLQLLLVIHPSATVSRSAELGEGTVVMAGAVINPGAQVGRGAIINSGAVVEHDVVIGDYAHVSPSSAMGGGARLGEMSHLGLGAVVLPGIKVGDRSIVGAGACVTKPVPSNTTVVGVPAKPLLRS
jgi:sugar O-acyltransferase (sialic acid O-acetyltransferase NeuD family)